MLRGIGRTGPGGAPNRYGATVLSDDDIRSSMEAFLARRSAGTRTTALGAGSDDLESGLRYLQGAAAQGWAVPAWPAGLGGRGASAEDVRAIRRVQREFAVPDLYVYQVGLAMVGPTLLAHGTDEQQHRWMPAIADASEIWCQMFSEPEAGSDLANVAMKAERDGDEWHLEGQKVWTSRGMWASWGLVLARTDPEVPKHAGLTMFAIRMDDPAVEVRPLVQMNGDRHFSEVFVSGARVPDDWRIGELGAGWNVAVTVLAHERASAGGGGGGGERKGRGGPPQPPSWLRRLEPTGVLEDPVQRQRAMRAHAADQAGAWTNSRAASSRTPGPAGSGAKLRSTRRYRDRAYFALDAQGPAGMLADVEEQVEFLTAPSMSIRGGTDEIQRNIVGERVLGLPAEPRVDRDAPWSRSRKGLL
ncbi:MAG: acyl-CoA dehydrogenase family protein [Acidimicrobiales bacterium]|nr:acyl-CoA dehydrogenase family protein [Acidimicrobiales bacterium]